MRAEAHYTESHPLARSDRPESPFYFARRVSRQSGGHGDPVHDYEELFNRYLRAIRERQAEVIKLLPKAGATAWDVSREMFPETDDVHRFLAVSEAVAHLDLAHSEGKIALELGEGREVYRRV